MKTIRLAACLFLMATLASCAMYDISTDYDPSADFADLKTWNWEPQGTQKTGDARIDSNSLLAERVRSAVETQLAAQGYLRQTSGAPDFLVGWHASIKDKMDVQTINSYYGYGPGWGWNYYGGPGFSDTYTYYYEEGTLILDIVNAKNHQLIWRGSAKGTVDEKATPEKRQKNIDEAVKDILAKFPPTA